MNAINNALKIAYYLLTVVTTEVCRGKAGTLNDVFTLEKVWDSKRAYLTD